VPEALPSVFFANKKTLDKASALGKEGFAECQIKNTRQKLLCRVPK
jgi:hypothetical protein